MAIIAIVFASIILTKNSRKSEYYKNNLKSCPNDVRLARSVRGTQHSCTEPEGISTGVKTLYSGTENMFSFLDSNLNICHPSCAPGFCSPSGECKMCNVTDPPCYRSPARNYRLNYWSQTTCTSPDVGGFWDENECSNLPTDIIYPGSCPFMNTCIQPGLAIPTGGFCLRPSFSPVGYDTFKSSEIVGCTSRVPSRMFLLF